MQQDELLPETLLPWVEEIRTTCKMPDQNHSDFIDHLMF
jgi:hypothetical protein